MSTYSRPGDFEDVLRNRPYPRHSLPVRGDERTWLQSFWHVLRTDGIDAPVDERRYRWISGALSLLLNLIFAVALIYFMYVQYLAMHEPPPEDEAITLVEFTGRGNPLEGGGDAQPSQQPAPATASAPSAAAASAATAAASNASPASAAEQAQETPPAPPRVTLSEPREDPEAFELPDVRLPSPSTVASPTMQLPRGEVTVREIGAPVERPQINLPTPVGNAPQASIAMPTQGIRERSIAAPATGTAATPSLATSATTGTTGRASAPASTGTAAAARPTGSGTASSTGPRSTPAPGGWYQNRPADDWGNSTRNRDGSSQGSRNSREGMLTGNDLFDEQGKPKLPYKGSASRNDPPGLRNGEIRDLDRAGTWRKRRPTDIGGSGSMVWLPNEDVLEELVRRGIKDFQIKIPGTSSVLRCRISLLQLGGGCMPDDPNMQDQEAVARPPPSVPYKPELNQHNGGRQTDTPPADFGPGAIMPGQQIKKVDGSTQVPPPQKKPSFKFED